MLTENGFDEALKLLNIPQTQKEFLPTKSFEVQKIVKKLIETARPENYNPFDKGKKFAKITRESAIRNRGFRQAVIEAYDCKCAVCGLKINSPDSFSWEVEAAHIVPNSLKGKDDLWNGVALCHIHHWAFDVGWFTLLDDYKIQLSSKANNLPNNFGRMEEYEVINSILSRAGTIFLPERTEIHPHKNSIQWHRENIFHP